MAQTSEHINLRPGHSGVIFEVGEPEDHALGRSRGGFGTKINLVVDGNGLPLAVELKAGQEHEINSLESLLDSVSVVQPRGAPKKRPDALAGDKGYSAAWIRNWLASYKIEDVIPTKENEQRNPDFDKEKYRRRNIVERAIGWLKHSRRIATRFEKLATRFLGMIHLEIIMTYLGELPDTT
jgi:transposase